MEKNKYRLNQLITILAFMGLLSCGSSEPPSIVLFEPDFGPPETLITVRGANFENLVAINFNEDVPADFNPSFGKDSALLFRVPMEAPLGDNDILIKTENGEITFPFRVTLEAPQVKDFFPKSANAGETIYIIGENFFEPLEILFFDSIPGTLKYMSPDSIVVEVPPNVQRGRIIVKANGGSSSTKENFFSVTQVGINDFDGNGLRAETDKWLFYGNIEQTATNAVMTGGPSGNYLKISGTDPGSIWVGGTESNQDGIENFGVVSDLNNTFLEMDISNNGKDKTHLIFIVKEKNGSFNDFQITEHIDWEGWRKITIPLNRFKDINGAPPDPTKLNLIKLHLYNELGSSQSLEVNLDNINLIQVN